MEEKKKKMLITASTFPRWENDTEPRFILDYAKAMRKYYDVTVLAPMTKGAKEKEEMEGVAVLRYHYCPIRKWETLCYPGAIVPRIKEKKMRVFLVPFLILSLSATIKRISKDYDLVHAHWIIPQGICQMHIKETPYIVTGHGGDVTSLNIPIISQLKRKCLARAKLITVVSEDLKNYVGEMYADEKVKVISMGCDTSKFGSQYYKENLFNQGDKRVILYVGRLAEKKGVAYLIEAMKYVKDAQLVIVGTGDLEDQLKKQAFSQGGEIIFMGGKTHEELSEIYASADVFVAPSITANDGDKEGFGLVILEAMASGTPVVASKSGGIVDIITDNENGLLVEEKDSIGIAKKINEILDDQELAQKLIDNGKKTAESFSYESIAERFMIEIENMW